MTTTLTAKNQVTIPADMVRHLGLTPGSQLDWTGGKIPGQIIVTVRPTRRKLIERAQEIGRRYKRGGQDEVTTLIKAREVDDKARSGN